MDDLENLFNKEKLHFAVQDNNINEVMKLIKSGYDINLFDELGLTPLHYAVMNENIEIAEYLLKCGADVDAHDEKRIGNTPLAEIAQECSYQIAELLISYGADPSIPGWMQLTAIHRAQNRKKPEGIKVCELFVDRMKNPIKYKKIKRKMKKI